jgi:hypothetical protein
VPFTRKLFISKIATIVHFEVAFEVFHLIAFNEPHFIIALAVQRPVHLVLYDIGCIFIEYVMYIGNFFSSIVVSFLENLHE